MIGEGGELWNLLTLQSIANIRLGCSSTKATELMGDPALRCEVSASHPVLKNHLTLLFGRFQFNFEYDKLVAINYHLGETLFEILPSRISESIESDLDEIHVYEKFLSCLDSSNILFTQFDDKFFKKVRIKETQVSFMKSLNLPECRKHGREIRYENYMLRAIRIGNTI